MDTRTGEVKEYKDTDQILDVEYLMVIRANNISRELVEQIKKTGSGMVGRNDSCPCGSGVKFKKCCLGKKVRHDRG